MKALIFRYLSTITTDHGPLIDDQSEVGDS